MICLTFDTDHMSQAAMSRFLAGFAGELPGRATFFAHDLFPGLMQTEHEICPHPFIADLNAVSHEMARIEGVIGRRAAGTRPHSCVFSHMVAVELKQRGYTWVSQAHTMYATNLEPFRHPWGVWELPIYYMDNMDFWMARNWSGEVHEPFAPAIIEHAVSGDALFVFDLHPIHIALNTRSPDDYAQVKDRVTRDGVSPFDLAFSGHGARAFFNRLCQRMRETGQSSMTCSDALRTYQTR